MSLQLDMTKGQKLKLSMTKGEIFTVELLWTSEEDLDAHVLQCIDDGNGAKAQSFDDVLSTYNLKRPRRPGVLIKDANGSFALPCGSMRHSGDIPSGRPGVGERITIDGEKVPEGYNQIPVFVTIAPNKETGTTATFSAVKDAGIRIKDSTGKVLAEYRLSAEFARFNAVQIGTLMLSSNGWEFTATGSGFNGDFNYILENFS